jgi:hypothetical protein
MWGWFVRLMVGALIISVWFGALGALAILIINAVDGG